MIIIGVGIAARERAESAEQNKTPAALIRKELFYSELHIGVKAYDSLRVVLDVLWSSH